MTERPTVMLHLKDLSHDDQLRESIQKRCDHLTSEFREITRVEITLTEDGSGYVVHGHVTGKDTNVGTQASASKPGPAADLLLDKVERQLRRVHDKRIFSQRRDAQKTPPKRKTPS